MSFVLGPDGTPIRKRDLSDWSVTEDTKITAMCCDQVGSIYVAKKEPLSQMPTMTGNLIANQGQPAQFVKRFPDTSIVTATQEGINIKAVVRLSTGVVSSRYIEASSDSFESTTISLNALNKLINAPANSYIASNPNSDTRTRVSISKYNAQKQFVEELWSGQSPFAINGICVRNGQVYYTHESQVRMLTPGGSYTAVAGTPYPNNYSSSRLQNSTTYARTFMLGNPYGIAYDATTDLIFFTDVDHAAVYSVNVDTGIQTAICAGSTDIVAQIDDAERPSTDCFIQDAAGIAAAPDGTIYVSSVSSGQIYKLRKDYDTAGNLVYFISIFAGYNSQVTTLASEDDRPAKYARIRNPLHLAVDANLQVYYFEQTAGLRIRYIQPDIYRTYFKGRTGAFNYWPLQVIMNNSPEGYTKELATDATSASAGTAASNVSAAISFEFYANHLATDEEGNVYFCDPVYGTLNRVTTNNEVQVIANNMKDAYSLAVINNTDIWICTLDRNTTTNNSLLYRVPYIQNPAWPMDPDTPITLNTRIQCMAAHPRGFLILAGETDGTLYIYDIANASISYTHFVGMNVSSMCLGMNNTILYLTTSSVAGSTYNTDANKVFAYTIRFDSIPIRTFTITAPAWPLRTSTTDIREDYWLFEFQNIGGDALMHVQVRFFLENGQQRFITSSRKGSANWIPGTYTYSISDFGITRAGGQTLIIEFNGTIFTITSQTPKVTKTFVPLSGLNAFTGVNTISFIGQWANKPTIIPTSDVQTTRTTFRLSSTATPIAGNSSGDVYTPAAMADTTTPTNSPLVNPRGIAYNAAEKCLYVTCGLYDQTNPKFVRSIALAADGRSATSATTLIGSTSIGLPLSGSSYSSVSLMYPTGIACTLQGSLYIIDTMNARDVTTATSVLIRAPSIFFLKPDLVYAFAGSGVQGTAEPTDGTLTQRVALSTINGITLDRDGNVFFTTNWNTIHRIDALTYKISKINGATTLNTPRSLVYSRSGTIYFTEGTKIRSLTRVAGSGYTIGTLAGDGTATYTAGAQVSLVNLGITTASATLCIDAVSDTLYVSVKDNFRIFRIDSFKRVYLVTNMSALGTSTSEIHSICRYGNYLYVCVPDRNTIYRVDLGNTNTTGNYIAYISSSASGTPATWIDAGLNTPYGIAADKQGNMYVSMRGRHTIKRYSVVSPTANPIVDSGNSYIGIDGLSSYGDGQAISGIIDGMYRMNSRIHSPTLLALDVYNRLFFVDQGKNRICCLATGVDLDSQGIPTNYIRVESAGPGRTFSLSRFDVYNLETKVYDPINVTREIAAQQALRSVDIQPSAQIVITYINVKANDANSIDSKVYLYNQYREIMAVQTITNEALKLEGQNLIFIESWTQENVPAIRNQLMNVTRGIQRVSRVGLIDTNNAIEKFVIVTATQDDQIQTFTYDANAARYTTIQDGTTQPTEIQYVSSAAGGIEVLCVFLMRRPGGLSDALKGNGIDNFPVQVILRDSAGAKLKHKVLVVATPNNIRYEMMDFRLNSELYSTLSMDAIYEAVFGVKRIRYVRIFFSETGASTPAPVFDIKIRNICVVSVENGTNVAYGKPVYDSGGNSYSTLTDESNMAIGRLSTGINWLEVDLQYPAMIDRVMLNRADDDTMEYFIQGFTERRELVPFPGSAENPFSQKTSVVYVSGSGYNVTKSNMIFYFSRALLNDYQISRNNAMNMAAQALWQQYNYRSNTSFSVYLVNQGKCSDRDTWANGTYTCALNGLGDVSYHLQIQKLLAYTSNTDTTDRMISANVTLRSSGVAGWDTGRTAMQALIDDTNYFISDSRTNNAFWEANYNTPTYLKKFILKQDPNENEGAKARMFGINLRHYNQKRRLLGRYGARGNYDSEDFTYTQSPYQIPMLLFKRGVSGVRYVRMSSRINAGDGNSIIQLSQIAVFDTAGNMVSLNRPVTTASTPPTINNISNDKDWITQGHLYPSMYKMYASYWSNSEWIQVDLGANFTGEIESVVYYNRFGELNTNLDQIVGNDLTSRAAGQEIQLLDTNGTLIPNAKRTLKGGLLREALDFRPAADDQTQYVCARYVRIENPGPITSGAYTPTTMTFTRLKVNDVYGVNTACGKVVDAVNYTARDGSTIGGGETTDTKYNPIKSEPSNYTIGEVPGSYWEIDLGEEISIKSVEFTTTAPTNFKYAPLNFYDEDRSLIAQYFMNPTETTYRFTILGATNPTFTAATQPLRFVQIRGRRNTTGVTITDTDLLKIGQLIVLDNAGINIALGKPVYSSGFNTTNGLQRRAYYATNGRCSNWFQSAIPPSNSDFNSGDQYFEVDLGGTYNVSAIILRGYANVESVQTFKDIVDTPQGRERNPDHFTQGNSPNITELKFVASEADRPRCVPTPRTGIGKKARYVRLRQPPIPIATNIGENGIALSQILVIDAVGRNVALGKNVYAYPSTPSTLPNINNGFYDSDTWNREKSIYNPTGTCDSSIWNNANNGRCGNSMLSDANWNGESWNTSVDTSWIEVDLGAEYWITDIIIHDIRGNEYSQANYDVILRDTYYNMVYNGVGVITSASRSLNIVHKRTTNSTLICPVNSRQGSGSGGTETGKCYMDCAPNDILAGDARTSGVTSQLNCYAACPSQPGRTAYDTLEMLGTGAESAVYSRCSVCPNGSTYDRSALACLTDCPDTHEPTTTPTGDKICKRYCVTDPSGAPMTWADPVTRLECKTAAFEGTAGQTRMIVNTSIIQPGSSSTAVNNFIRDKPLGVAIIKSKDVYSDYWRAAKTNVIRNTRLKEYQDSGRARLLFKYYYDNTTPDNKFSFNGIINRTTQALTTQARPTIAKRVVPKTTDTENVRIREDRFRYIQTLGTNRRYEIYLDWTESNSTKRFYALDSPNPIYIFGRSYSQSLNFTGTRTAAPVFPLPTIPFDNGSCPAGYTEITNPSDPTKPCKLDRPSGATENNGRYFFPCPAGSTAINNNTQCRPDCTGNRQVYSDTQCITRPPTNAYVLTEGETNWILCDGTDPNGRPYRYENGASKFVFNSLCYVQNNPSIPNAEKLSDLRSGDIGYNFDPADRGLWKWFTGSSWAIQWTGFNEANTFANGQYSRIPGCYNKCVTQKPARVVASEAWPYFVHTWAHYDREWGLWPVGWAWAADVDVRSKYNGQTCNPTILNESSFNLNWRKRNYYAYRNLLSTDYDSLNASDKARYIFVKDPSGFVNATKSDRIVIPAGSIAVTYEPKT